MCFATQALLRFFLESCLMPYLQHVWQWLYTTRPCAPAFADETVTAAYAMFLGPGACTVGPFLFHIQSLLLFVSVICLVVGPNVMAMTSDLGF